MLQIATREWYNIESITLACALLVFSGSPRFESAAAIATELISARTLHWSVERQDEQLEHRRSAMMDWLAELNSDSVWLAPALYYTKRTGPGTPSNFCSAEVTFAILIDRQIILTIIGMHEL